MASLPAQPVTTPRKRPALVPSEIVPLLILFYAMLLPPEVRIDISDQTFQAPRLVSFVLLPWVIRRILRGFVFHAADLWLFAGATWMVVSFVVYYGVGEGLLRGGALAFDVVAPYLVARLSIRDRTDFLRFLIFIVPGVVIIGAVMAAESLGHRHILRPAAANFFGSLSKYENGTAVSTAVLTNEIRLGMLRAYGPFSHPILGGLFMASLLPLFFSSGLRKWPLWLGTMAGAFALFSGSTAAYLALILAAGLTVYDRVQRQTSTLNWPYFIFGSTILLGAIQFFSSNGLLSVVTRYAINTNSAEFRRAIWDYGSQSVMHHPVFGIGYTNYERLWWMGSSVDNHWLMMAIRHGVIAPTCILIACGLIVWRLCILSRSQPEIGRRFYVSYAMTLTILIIMGLTVAFFGSMKFWFFALVGAGMSIGLPALAVAPAMRPAGRPLPRNQQLAGPPPRGGALPSGQ